MGALQTFSREKQWLSPYFISCSQTNWKYGPICEHSVILGKSLFWPKVIPFWSLLGTFFGGTRLGHTEIHTFYTSDTYKKAWREAGHFIVRKGFGTTAQTTCEHVVCNIYAVEGQWIHFDKFFFRNFFLLAIRNHETLNIRRFLDDHLPALEFVKIWEAWGLQESQYGKENLQR